VPFAAEPAWSGDRVAVVTEDATLTYDDLAARLKSARTGATSGDGWSRRIGLVRGSDTSSLQYGITTFGMDRSS